MKTSFLAAGLALTLCATLGPVRAENAVPAAAPDDNVNAIVAGSSAPAFTAHDLVTGKPVASADFAGKILVLNFWATWCPPCRAETPDMVAAYRSLHGPDVAFLGIDTTEVPSVVKTFVSAKSVPYEIALGNAAVYNGFGVAYIPTTVVVDAHGVVRAKWTGGLDPRRLAQFVADARAQKNYVIDTPEETIVERLLDPAAFDFTTNGAAYAAEAKRAQDDVAAAEALAEADGDGKDATVDFATVEMLEGRILLASAHRAQALAATDADKVAADRLLATADGKLNRYADAIVALQDAQKLSPSDATLDLDIAKADYRLHDYPAGIAAATAYTAAMPNDSNGWDFLGLLDQRSRDFASAAPAYEKSIALLERSVTTATTPSDRADAVANTADEALDLADVEVALGDTAGTVRAFGIAKTYGDRIDPHGEYAVLYRNVHERTQEGLIAVALTRGGRKLAVSVAPWTGTDLPGSLPSTLKYRLIVASTPNATAQLHVVGLRPGWVASFCADGLCSPNRVAVALGAGGVKTYEFQLVPPGSARAAGDVSIVSSGGTTTHVPPPGRGTGS